VRNLAPNTQHAYLDNVARFARHFGRSPAELGPEEIRAYQVYLIRERHLAPSSLEIAVCALRFLYTVTLHKGWPVDAVIPAPKKPRRLPVVLSPAEVVHFLACVAGLKHRAILTTWWRIQRPRPWLFPGEPPEQPITSHAVRDACQRAHRRSQLAKPVTPHSLLHVLPLGFHRIRYYGFLSPRHRRAQLARCRHRRGSATSAPTPRAATPARDYRDRVEALTGVSLRR